MSGNINIVIGSWGSYNECNERALGSKWLDLSDYSDWDEIVEELKKEGFELDGIDEELFIQDVEGIEDRSVNWDYVNPETLFNTLKESGVLDDDYKYNVFCAFLEVRSYDDFEEKVNSHGDRWDDCINLWSGYSWEDYGKEMLDCCGYQIPEHIIDFIKKKSKLLLIIQTTKDPTATTTERSFLFTHTIPKSTQTNLKNKITK